MTDKESSSSEEQELHAATGTVLVGLLGPADRLQEFIEEWVQIASKEAVGLQRLKFPDIQLIPMAEDAASE